MPLHATWEPRGIYVHYAGQTSDTEIAGFARNAQADPRFTDIRYVVHDFRECTGLVFTPVLIQELSAYDYAASFTNPAIKIAVVTDREDVIAMVRTYLDTGLPGFVLKIFTTIEQAHDWLKPV